MAVLIAVEQDYASFLDRKTQLAEGNGIRVDEPLGHGLFGFQEHLTRWALERGRSAIFADCGMGKTPMQLVWADRVARATNRKVLILTPLAVSYQTLLEAEKFGVSAARSQMGELPASDIVITNYERLRYFNPSDFAGVVCDESSILKSFDGATRQAVTEFMRKVPYRLLCTATAAPNDYIELGTSSEALGHLGYMDMLNRFFKNDNHNSATRRFHGEAVKWRFKGHAELPFWRWVCSWAKAVRRPSDIGFEDDGFILPPLYESEHIVTARRLAPGQLFAFPAISLPEQREERRRTIEERCERLTEIVDHDRPALVWCHLNDEGDMLERMITGAVQISGKDRDEVKEERFRAFAAGQIRCLVTKPKIGAWGLNFQHCAHVGMFPSHSYEQYYQGVRRCWRFGQTQPVQVDIVTTEGESAVLKNLQRKAAAADRMFTNLVAEMNRSVGISRGRTYTQAEAVPSWL